MKRIGLTALAVLSLSLLPVRAAVTNYVEDFNDSGLQEHNWQYWGVLSGGSLTGDHDTAWTASGGVSNSGRITTDLSLTRDVYNGYWPFYLLQSNRDSNQNLNFANHTVSARFNSHGDSDPFNGGELYFFIGEWLDETHYSFYRYNTSFAFNVEEGVWTNVTTISISGSPSEWTLFAGQNEVSVTGLFNNPQQYGFVILGQSSQPTNLLSMDDFEARLIPEPATLSLLGAALGLAFLSRGRRCSA